MATHSPSSSSGAHGAEGEVCLSPGDHLRAGDSSGGDGEAAQPVRSLPSFPLPSLHHRRMKGINIGGADRAQSL